MATNNKQQARKLLDNIEGAIRFLQSPNHKLPINMLNIAKRLKDSGAIKSEFHGNSLRDELINKIYNYENEILLLLTSSSFNTDNWQQLRKIELFLTIQLQGSTGNKELTPHERAVQRIKEAARKKSKSLDLSDMNLNKIPQGIAMLGGFLKKLNLENNEIKQIENLDKLTNLTLLHLAENKIGRIENLDKLEKLRTLYLYSNKISRIENLDKLRNLTTLALGENEIRQIENLGKLSKLTTLNLFSNKISRIENLDELRNLTTLALTANEISRIENLGKLNNLTALKLFNNKISKIENLDELINLTTLYLYNNKISRIENLDKLIKLTTLVLHSNKISRIENLNKLRNLETLYLHSNLIKKLEGFGSLTNLRSLYLSNNQIGLQKNDELLLFHDMLRQKIDNFILQIDENSFFQEIAGFNEKDYLGDSDANHTKNFLADCEQFIFTKKELVDHILPHKLIVLGNSNSGKTSLVHYLVKNKLLTKKEPESTDTVNIVPWKDKESPEFMIYDFGGQDYYHATYQLFFSKEASYIVLWSKDNNNNQLNGAHGDSRVREYHCFDVNYWLGNIKYLHDKEDGPTEEDKEKWNGGWCKNLCLVENKIDLPNEDGFPLQIDSDFGDFEKFKVMLNKQGDPLTKKRRAWLKDYLKHLHPISRKELPERKEATDDYLVFWKESNTIRNEWSFSDLKKELENKYKSWKSLDEVDVRRILNRLVGSGLLIWFPNDDVLKDRIWISPVKLRVDILKLLNQEHIKAAHPVEELDKDEEFLKWKDLLLKQQIIFIDKTYNNEYTPYYIIPKKLPRTLFDEPFFAFATSGLSTTFIVKFKNFMPLGIMNRLIIMVGNLPDKKIYSRYQVVFTLDDHKVLMTCDMERLSIEIQSNITDEDLIKQLFYRILLAYYKNDYIKVKEKYEVQAEQDINLLKPKKVEYKAFYLNLFALNLLVPADLQIALSDQIFVNYQDLLSANENNLHHISGSASDGQRHQILAHLFNAFVDKPFRKPKSVFISYSHDDVDFRKELQKHLRNLERDNLIAIWQDSLIQPGDQWDETIKQQVRSADIVILLVSQNLIDSNYSNEVELRMALSGYESKRTHIFPILIKNCDFEHWKALPENVRTELEDIDKYNISNFQFLPKEKDKEGLLALNQWQHPENAWKQIVNKLRAIAEG